MIYSIVSLEDIFAEQPTEQIVTERIDCGYAEYAVCGGRKTLRRVFSTDPRRYLDVNYRVL